MAISLQEILKSAKTRLSSCQTEQDLQAVKTEFLGKKSELIAFLKTLKDLSEDQKKEQGVLANEVKNEIARLLEQKKEELAEKLGSQKTFLDVTQPGTALKRGSLHPLSKIQYQVEDIFSSMGFQVLDGPELESDYFCFEALNMPSHHPARESQDTFYMQNPTKTKHKFVMRTHTSAMQVRALLEYGAPIRAIFPGRCFRNEATDASHEHTFYQVEGLVVDKNVSIANLIAVMKSFLSAMFQKEVTVRLRPGFFPFVEPGFELDIACLICGGVGCKVCKYNGWLEILPCGMIHPKVLEFGKVDTKTYSGFAFGLGLDRVTMMKFGIDDIRHFHSGLLSFINQF